jgi:hypothetical protein
MTIKKFRMDRRRSSRDGGYGWTSDPDIGKLPFGSGIDTIEKPEPVPGSNEKGEVESQGWLVEESSKH